MSNILKFFVKKILVVYVVLLIVCFLSKYQRIPMIFALTCSILFSLLRFALAERILKSLANGGKKNRVIVLNVILYVLNLFIIGVIIVMSLKIGGYTFVAALIGTFSVIIIIMINAITEALGITRNHFGQKVK